MRIRCGKSQANSEVQMHCIPHTPPSQHAPNWLPKPRFQAFSSLATTISPLAGYPDYLLVDVALPGPPSSLVFLSDLHWNGRELPRFQRLANAIRNLEPDWLVFGGDACVFMDTVPGALEWLASLTAKRGRIAVLGNREAQIPWLDHDFWKDLYQRIGWTCLFNEVLDTGDGPLFFGTEDARYGHPDWNPVQQFFAISGTRPVISISHNPDTAADQPTSTFLGNLILCGHTHGGQFNFPILGPLYTSSRYGRQFYHGWAEREDGTLMLTSSGIGESGFGFLHHRLHCPPEIVRIQFHS
ncbi:MAG: metallophosphoesterase [Victivallales bacterium]|nr:metallophosphoesterase [Victivallales bacterium]